jgi:hypothetical protein
MWWFSLWGTWRYEWLINTTVRNPLRNKEDVDLECIMVLLVCVSQDENKWRSFDAMLPN